VLPGKKYRPEDVLDILRRRKWLLLGCFLPAVLAAVVVARMLPSVYESEALVLVVPQRIPEKFVSPTVTTDISDRIRTISQQILSRTRLERIIEEFDLYPEQRRTGIMQDVVDNMRANAISVDIPRQRGGGRRNDDAGTSFRLAFRADNPRKAMQVTERLASVFIEENLRDREVLAEGADQFLESQLEEARQQLLTVEKQLEEYKRLHANQLPTQQQTNLQVMQHAETQLQQLQEAQRDDRNRLLGLDRLMSEAQLQAAAPVAPPATREDENAADTRSAADRLESARKALAQLELRYKPEHPDIVRLKRTIGDLEKQASSEAVQQPLGGGATVNRPLSQSEVQRRTRVAQLEAEKVEVSSRLAQREAEERRLRAQIGQYRARVEAAPTRELELVGLTRDYDTLKERYSTLLSKREDARIAANLERRQIGEQFKLIEPPRMPERPVSPNRTMIWLLGAAAGLGLGLGLTALLEYRDSSFRTDEDVTAALALPVLALIPRMDTASERARQRRRRRLVSVAAAVAAMTIAGLALLAWRFGGLPLGS
jgi:polysaccharide chain length determinant protein (PEP-CTERM system associated)